MSRSTSFERYDNGKIKLQYLTVDLGQLTTAIGVFEDKPEILGKILVGFYDYERSGGENMPKLDIDDPRDAKIAQLYLETLIEKHELCRQTRQTRSEQNRAANEAKQAKRRPLRDLD